MGRVDAKNAFDGYIHSMRSATEGSGDNKGLSEKMDSDEKEKILDALKDGQSWLDSNPEADAEEIKEKHKEIEGICAPIVSKYYGAGGGGGGGAGGDEDEDEAHDELQESVRFLMHGIRLDCKVCACTCVAQTYCISSALLR